jgi:acetyl esterase
VDPELAAVIPLIPALPFSDLATTRATIAGFVDATPIDLTGVRRTDRVLGAGSGLRIFAPDPAPTVPVPGLLEIHGGGFAVGSAALDDATNATIVRALGIVVVSVDYRLAPEHPFPAGLDDCCTALRWTVDHAAELGIDPDRLGVLGESAGAGLAAATALRTRHEGGPRLRLAALLEPELDDRMDTPSMRSGASTVGWNSGQALLSWRYYLGERVDAPPRYAAPAREPDLDGFPPTYLTVNELDPLRDEGLDFARRLLETGVPTELHSWPGTFHGFRTLCATAAVACRAESSLLDALTRGLEVTAGHAVEEVAR